MASGSQEKTHEATHHHLKKAREKGQVASSAQFVSATVSLAVILWIAARYRTIVTDAASFFNAAFSGGVFAPQEDLHNIVTGFVWTLLGWIMPIALIGGMAGIVANIGHKGGLVVSFHPIAPDFSRITPAKGFERMFSRNSMIQLLFGLLSLVVFGGASVGILMFLFPQILNSPLCGGACAVGAQLNAFSWLLVTGFIALTVAGVADLPLQMQNFGQEMKMTAQELKQESRETEGSPEMKQARRRAYNANNRSLGNAPTLILMRGGEAVGLRYLTGETPAPLVVAKGRDETAQRILRLAKAARTPIFTDAGLVQRLMSDGRIGSPIPEKEFRAVAPYILRVGR